MVLGPLSVPEPEDSGSGVSRDSGDPFPSFGGIRGRGGTEVNFGSPLTETLRSPSTWYRLSECLETDPQVVRKGWKSEVFLV